MFTWIPIHEETAKRLLDFKDRNHELVEIFARMHAAGLKASSMNDRGADGSHFQLKEIDPFTFFANFNRGVRDDNRQAMWQFLKDEWKLVSEVPQDFEGLPVANNQASWLIPYAKDRIKDHVPLLWKFFNHIISVEPATLDAVLMQECLDLQQVGMTMLTMGMFWSNPAKWISTDGKNVEFAKTKGIPDKPKTAAEYLIWLPKVREVIGGDGVEFSRQAHLWSLEKLPLGSSPIKTVPPISPVPPIHPDSYRMENALAELFMSREALEHILEQLKRKKNIILQGAPGVGKTFIAKRLAWLQLGLKDESAVEMVQFHQSYTYEDFVQGLRPTQDGHFAVKAGCFYRLCKKALADPQRDFFLVIDEINRGNLSKILGELMMLIETDKRGERLTLAYSEEPFTVPPNLYLIGTMNTADRSLSLVDYALRRRFAFLALDPGFETDAFSAHLGRHGITASQIHHIRNQMAALNHEIAKDETNLGAGYRIGHSFFTPVEPITDFARWFRSIVHYEIMPLLEEYWIDEPKMVQQFRITLTESIP